MYRQDTSARFVVRHFIKRIAGALYIRIISRNKQMTLCIVSACRTDYVNKILIDLIYQIICVRLIFIVKRIKSDLVHRLENQIVRIVFESLCYLLPYIFVFLQECIIILLRLLDYPCTELRITAAVVMYIYNNIHSLRVRIIDYLLYPVHPFPIYVALAIHVISPRHRYTHRIYAVLFQRCEQLFCGFRIAPQRFINLFSRFNMLVYLTVAVTVSLTNIKRITEVPAERHIFNQLL